MATSKQVKHVPNPTGRGGFTDNPQNRSDGRWDKEQSISYQYHSLMRMSPAELKAFKPQTVAQEIALKRLTIARTVDGLADAKEVTDRTEGKAPQSIDLKNNGGAFEPVVVKIIDAGNRNTS